MDRLPPLYALRSFEAAARTGSFTLAADELCVTTGAVSRQVKQLEEHLGVALFARHHRKVVLTDGGRRYQQTVASVFDALRATEDELRRSERRELVLLDCVPTLSMYWLMPKLAQYRERHPEVQVEVTTNLGRVRDGAAFDLAIRRDPAHFAGMAGTSIMREWSVLVCSPQFAAENALTKPEKLSRHPLIQIRAREDLWSTWSERFATAMSGNAKHLTVDHTFAAIQAAEDGMGVAVIPLLFVQKHLASGRLITPFPDMAVDSGKYYVLSREAVLSPAAMRLRNWLIRAGKRESSALL